LRLSDIVKRKHIQPTGVGALSSRVPAGLSVVGLCLTARLLDVFEAKLVFIRNQRCPVSPHGKQDRGGRQLAIGDRNFLITDH
jgi:hypothetical protein